MDEESDRKSLRDGYAEQWEDEQDRIDNAERLLHYLSDLDRYYLRQEHQS